MSVPGYVFHVCFQACLYNLRNIKNKTCKDELLIASMIANEERHCVICHLTCPIDSFTLNKKGNYHKCCNICLDKKKKYYEENKSCILMRNSIYRKNNKENVNILVRNWKLNNKEKIAETQRSYYLRNRDKLLQYQREYDSANKEK